MAKNNVIKLLNNKDFSEGTEAIADSMIEIIKLFSPDEGDGEDVFNTLLNMDDENLKLIAPVFMEEFQTSFSDPQIQLTLTSLMNYQDVTYEEMMTFFDELVDEISFEETLSETKKDFLKSLFICMRNGISESEGITKRIIQIPVELTDKNAKIPTYANVGDAAADIYALEDYDIGPGEQVVVRTGVKVVIPWGYAVLIQPRSGLSSKSKLRICNTPGLIDSGYRGEICVLVENIEPPVRDVVQNENGVIGIEYGRSYKIEAGDRIAQMRLVEVPVMSFAQVDSIEVYGSERGEGGFGSTGMK